MAQLAVNPAVGDQPHQVQRCATVLNIIDQFDKRLVFKKAAVPNSRVDSENILINNSAGPDIEMSHFGIAHNSPGQTDRFAGAQQLRVGVFLHQFVQVRRSGQIYGIAVMGRVYTPPVQDHQHTTAIGFHDGSPGSPWGVSLLKRVSTLIRWASIQRLSRS